MNRFAMFLSVVGLAALSLACSIATRQQICCIFQERLGHLAIVGCGWCQHPLTSFRAARRAWGVL